MFHAADRGRRHPDHRGCCAAAESRGRQGGGEYGGDRNTEIIAQIAERFGAQCAVVSIDVRRGDDGKTEVFTRSGTQATGKGPIERARDVERLGAGEILLTSINRDGTLTGYDVDLIRDVAAAVSIPVIASGGAGNYEHMAAALREGGASAVAAASMFHFTEQTPLGAKKYLRDAGFHVRL